MSKAQSSYKPQEACEFCKILHSGSSKSSQTIIYQDQVFFAFHDIDKSSAKQHILLCTKQHIETALEIRNPQILIKMKQIGIKILGSLSESKEYRFGFHLPPYNSIDHTHLHCFVLPFSSFVKDKVIYGKLMSSVEEVIEKIKLKAKL